MPQENSDPWPRYDIGWLTTKADKGAIADETNKKLTQHLKEIEERLMWYERLKQQNEGEVCTDVYADRENRLHYQAHLDEKRRLLNKFPELADKVEQVKQEIQEDNRKTKERLELATKRAREALQRNLGTAYDCRYTGYPRLEQFMVIYKNEGLSDIERKTEEDKLIKNAPINYEGSDGHFHC